MGHDLSGIGRFHLVPSERGRNYTPPAGGALRPAGGFSAVAPVGAEPTSTGRFVPCAGFAS